jgi:hypothetical protein
MRASREAIEATFALGRSRPRAETGEGRLRGSEPRDLLPVTVARNGEGPSLVPAFGVWALLALVGVAVAVTYSRLPPSEFYNVSEGGIDGGLGRALVYVNFPTALIAIALVALAADRLAARAADLAAVASVLLCLVVALPGVVEQEDLDAKAVNAIPAIGVAVALALTVVAGMRAGAGERARGTSADWLRVAVALAALAAAIPWVFADLGFSLSDVPVLGSIFLADEVVPEPGNPDIRAVHFGHHHGMDGVLFTLSALVLSRELGRVRRRRLRIALTAYLALMLVYGLANALQDFWLEQLYKRDATSFRLPEMLRPDLGPEWAGIVVAAVAVYALFSRSIPPRPRRP